MPRKAIPDLPPGPLRSLIIALHELDGRAGWPSLDTIVDRQDRKNRDKRDHFGRDSVHRLFSKCHKTPAFPLLLEVVRILAEMAPRVDPEVVLDRFDELWRVADRYEGLALNLYPDWFDVGSEMQDSRGDDAGGDRHE